MAEKEGYTAIPFDDSQVPNERDLPPYSEKPRYTGPQQILNVHECYCQHRKKAWRKALLAILIVFLGGKLLYSFFLFNAIEKGSNNIFIDFIDDYESELRHHEIPHIAPPKTPSPPEAPVCEPTIKWNGPSELLLDPRDVTGLVFNVKGISARGSVIIRQDSSKEQKFINITNLISLSEDSLQKEVDIRIDIIDEDYTVTVEAPSFIGHEQAQKCVEVDTIITVPSNVHVFRSLVVDVPNSWILAENLGSIEFAYVNFRTRNGHIRAEDINASIAEITTVNGHVQGAYVIAESLDVRTVNGAIGIVSFINQQADEVSITTKSINGHLDITVDELSEKQVLNLKAGSVNGGAVASLPDTFHGDFSASTLIGYSYVEGKDITYLKKTRNIKVGHKGTKDDDDYDLYNKKRMRKKHKRCHHHAQKLSHKVHHDGDEKKESHAVVEAVTGAVELYFL